MIHEYKVQEHMDHEYNIHEYKVHEYRVHEHKLHGNNVYVYDYTNVHGPILHHAQYDSAPQREPHHNTMQIHTTLSVGSTHTFFTLY